MELLRLFETFFCSFIDIIIRASGSRKKDSEEYKKLCVKRKKNFQQKMWIFREDDDKKNFPLLSLNIRLN